MEMDISVVLQRNTVPQWNFPDGALLCNIHGRGGSRFLRENSRRPDCENPIGENLANGHIVNAVEQETVPLKAHSVMVQTCENEPEGNKQKQRGPFHHFRQCCANLLAWKISTIGLSAALLIAITIIIYQPGKLCPLSAAPSPPDATSPSPCPPHWVRNGSQCYYFSDTQENWNASQKSCSSEGGSLVTLETEEEKKFVQSFKYPYYWLGLWREEGERWRRADGSLFNNTFPVRGEGLCAYLNIDVVSSTWCDNKRHWICKKHLHGNAGRTH